MLKRVARKQGFRSCNDYKYPFDLKYVLALDSHLCLYIDAKNCTGLRTFLSENTLSFKQLYSQRLISQNIS